MSVLEGKIAIITGGSRGIGKAIAEAFAKEGARLLLVARSLNELQNTKKELEKTGSVEYLAGDVSDEQFVHEVGEFVKKTFSAVDILVNAAGIYGPIGRVEEIDPKEWRKTLEINLTGTFLMVRTLLPFLKKSPRGKIINFGGGGEGALPRFSAYVASKGGIVRFTETVAAEVKEFHIDVNAILPGAVNTKFLDELLEVGPDKVGEEIYKKSLKQKEEGGVPPEKAAQLALFLASPASDGLSGKTLSAVWDAYEDFPDQIDTLMASDLFTYRRVKPRK